MKTILILITFISLSFSAELLTFTKNNSTYSYCIDKYYIQGGDLYYKRSNSQYYKILRLYQVKNYDLKAGYIFERNMCVLNTKNIKDYTSNTVSNLNYKNLTELGLSLNDFNFLMAISGIITSFLFLFGLFRWI
ncbi:MAG: hypothetical protein WA916_06065 [Arcobacter sp.]